MGLGADTCAEARAPPAARASGVQLVQHMQHLLISGQLAKCQSGQTDNVSLSTAAQACAAVPRGHLRTHITSKRTCKVPRLGSSHIPQERNKI